MKHTIHVTLEMEVTNDSPSTQNAKDIAFVTMANFLNRYPFMPVRVTDTKWISVKP